MSKKIHYNIDCLLDTIRCVLDDANIEILEEISSQYVFQIKVIGGVNINVYTTGKIYVDGKKPNIYKIIDLVKQIDVYKWL